MTGRGSVEDAFETFAGNETSGCDDGMEEPGEEGSDDLAPEWHPVDSIPLSRTESSGSSKVRFTASD